MNPLKMTVICNIQAMAEKTGINITFEKLENKSISELWSIQDRMIVLYNDSLVKN